ncbi:hypothetical protein ACIRPS_17370 [Streptomyces griseoviridis]
MNNPSDVEPARDEERQVVEQLQAIPEGCGYGYGYGYGGIVACGLPIAFPRFADVDAHYGLVRHLDRARRPVVLLMDVDTVPVRRIIRDRLIEAYGAGRRPAARPRPSGSPGGTLPG